MPARYKKYTRIPWSNGTIYDLVVCMSCTGGNFYLYTRCTTYVTRGHKYSGVGGWHVMVGTYTICFRRSDICDMACGSMLIAGQPLYSCNNTVCNTRFTFKVQDLYNGKG
jgi:hypothetical protein